MTGKHFGKTFSRRWLIGVLSVALLLSGCRAATKNVTLQDEYLALSVGETFTVTLPANPTTGYLWQVDELDAALLAQDGEGVYEPEDTDEKMVGSGGETTFRFRALAAGETQLRLIYIRPWEENPVPAEVFEIHIKIH